MTAELQDAEGAALRLYNGVITLAAYSSGTGQCLSLCSDWRRQDIRRQQGQFRPPYQLCTVPQPTSVYTHTHLLTHPTAITPSQLPGYQACMRNNMLSCRSVREEKLGMVEQGMKCKCQKKSDVIMVQGP